MISKIDNDERLEYYIHMLLLPQQIKLQFIEEKKDKKLILFERVAKSNQESGICIEI